MATSVRFEQVTAPEVPEPKGNIFSNCLKVGDRLVLAGMVASDDAGGVIGGDSTYEQARACFAKIEKLVEAGGGSLADVAKLTIYLIDMADRPDARPRPRRILPGPHAGIDAHRRQCAGRTALSGRNRGHRISERRRVVATDCFLMERHPVVRGSR